MLTQNPRADGPHDPKISGDGAALRQEAERIQQSGVLGEARLRRLFDYLAEKSLAGQSPKEIAIAVDVFGKNSDFDVSQDALVRVYIHKLRKALEDFYASAAAEAVAELRIPRGEYRLKVSAREAAPAEAAFASRPPPLKLKHRQILGAAAALCATALLGAGIAWRWTPPSDLQRVRDNPIWAALLKDDRPIMSIVGDYYLIGETDDSMGVNRLIREYAVNSNSDLEHFVAEHPKLADRYMDVGEIGSDIMDPPQPTGKEKPYHDYGIFEELRGPGDNTIVVLSGTRDEGVRQTAEAFTSARKLEELKQKSDVTLPIEALLEVSAVEGVNLMGKLVLQSNRDKTSK
jgi:hypothetical protein